MKLNEEKPLVTVAIITRTKNRSVFLRRALESISQQTFKDFVWVVVNDGGDKEPVDQILALAIQRGILVKVVHIITSRGMEAASNMGIAAIDSDYIAIHDDDDSWESQFLYETVKFLYNQKEIKYQGVVTQSNKILESINGDCVRILKKEIYNPGLKSVYLAEMARGNFYPPISFVFQRATLSLVGLFDESLPVRGDWLFWCEMASKGDVYISGKVLNFFRNHEGDVSGKAYQTGLNFIEDFNVLVNLIDNELINEIEFYDSIERRYLKYISNKNNFTKEVQDRLNELFYKNIYTKKYRLKLKMKWFKENLNNKFRLILSNLGS